MGVVQASNRFVFILWKYRDRSRRQAAKINMQMLPAAGNAETDAARARFVFREEDTTKRGSGQSSAGPSYGDVSE
jgi:hypothetical protein